MNGGSRVTTKTGTRAETLAHRAMGVLLLAQPFIYAFFYITR